MSLLWFVALASLTAALLAWRVARAAARRTEQLSQMYWELKYQQGELRMQLQRAAGPDVSAAPGDAAAGARSVGAPRNPDAIIPLSSLKR